MPSFAWQLLQQSDVGEYEMILKERRAWLASVDIQNNPRLLAEWMALIQELDRVARESLGVDSHGFSSQPCDDDASRLHGRARSRSLYGTSGTTRSGSGRSTQGENDDASGGTRQRSRSFMGFLGAFVSRTIGGGKKASTGKKGARGQHSASGSISRTTSQPFPVRGATAGTPNGRATSVANGSGPPTPTRSIPANNPSTRNDKLRFALAMHKQQSAPDGGGGPNGYAQTDMTRDAARAMALARFSQEGGRASAQPASNAAAAQPVARGQMDHSSLRVPSESSMAPTVPAVLDIPEIRHVLVGLRDERAEALRNGGGVEGNARAVSWV
eukprot:m.8348 g.8348  ORF g.8348 m.8348 type:complete len:328 (-) comp6297_c1_seq1:66-1049(-)